MDEQRTQAYLTLINQLLSCNEGDEPIILQENLELLDQVLITKLLEIADQLRVEGDLNNANLLMNIAGNLLTIIASYSTKTDIMYIYFLRETFQKISKNNSTQVIYSFWKQNLDKLDDNLIKVLEDWAKNKLLSVNAEEAKLNAAYIANFSGLIQEFPLGKIAINKEIAIIGYEIALNILNFDTFPEKWASIYNNLCTAYLYRIRGYKADNLEEAIKACRKALKVRTFESSPVAWATTQANLATAYIDRIREYKADNLEKAIKACQKALKVFTFENLDCRQKWAKTQNNLANAYLYRIKENKADNLEEAIKACQEALKVFTFETFPEQWATTQNNLANTYSTRIRGDKAENLEYAITSYQKALKVHTYTAFHQEWAGTQHNLASAYLKRIRGKKAGNIEKAICHYTKALKVYTDKTFPYEWAKSKNNFSEVYLQRIKGEKAENIEQAIFCCTEALKVRTFNKLPQEWAETQNNLGNVYRNRIRGDKAENIEKAIASYHNALKIHTKDNDPVSCLKTARNLGYLHYEQKQWQSATEAYNTAIKALENARLEALNPQSRQEVLSNAIDVFHRIVQAYLNLNQPEKALEYIERSKGRNLVELMTQKALKPQGISQETIDKLAELKQQVVNEQIRLQHQSINQKLRRTDNLTPYVQDHSYLKEYQQELDDFIAENITPYDPTFTLQKKVQTIPFKDIKSLTDDSTCILQWYITREKILAFIVSVDGRVNYWESSKTNLTSLYYVINNYLTLYNKCRNYEHDQWKDKLNNFLETIARIIHINHIIALIPNTCERLIIIPHLFLHILPLHALPINNNCILQDKYDIQYAPSCQLLQITKQRPLNELTNLFAIQNPTKDLIFTDLEVNIISTLFNQKEIIAKDNATENTVTTQIKTSESHCYHFSCHGVFNPNNPLESALLLAKPDKLKLGEIFDLDLNKSRLVVLSACETGLIDLKSISDEYIGLPAGFLFAGSSSVVSSLWTVSDLSTSFLMMKFYEIILDKNKNISIPVALKMAQNWLKNLNSEQGIRYLETRIKPNLNQLYPNKPKSAQRFYNGLIKRLESAKYPFESPFYWAAFVASGL